MTSLSVELARSWPIAAELRQSWNELVSASGAAVQSPTWLEIWSRLYGAREGCEPRIVSIHSRGELIAVAPLVSRRRWVGPLPIRTLEWMGTGEAERHEVLSEYVGVLVRPGAERDAGQVLAAALERGLPGPHDEIRLAQMDGSSPGTLALMVGLEGVGLVADRVSETPCRYIPLPASWDDYLAALKGSRRARLRRALRTFERDVGTPVLKWARTPAEVRQWRPILEELHAARWREDGRRGVFAAPLFSAFHARALPALAAEGRAELSWIEVDGRPLAMLYNLLSAGRLHFYQSGRVTDLPETTKPGIVAHALAIQDAIDRGLREYDFLGGNARYKRDLALAERPLTTLTIRRSSPSAQWARGRELAGRWMRQARRQVSRLSVALQAQVHRNQEQHPERAGDDQHSVDQS